MSMTGKLCLVTGATSGHGRALATALARAGNQVILGCRNPELGDETRDRIIGGCPGARAEVLQLDLASRASIREAVRRLGAEHAKLDVLVNNAAAWWVDRRESVDGVELVWATNVLGPHFLTRLLLPLLSASGAGRIVNVASAYAGGLDLRDVEFVRRPYNGIRAYQASKQAVRMLTWALVSRINRERVVANALCPGFMKTGLGRNAPLGFRVMLVALRPFQLTPERGAETATWLASSPEAGQISNQFLVKCQPVACAFRDPEACEQLFKQCEAALERSLVPR
jgi:NAD(P)-dependent dehydrogenase (short-subunit alcohol dehydrogenase family)